MRRDRARLATKGSGPGPATRRTREEIEALVLDFLTPSNIPVGAYDIASRLSAEGHSIVPNQVYRTLSRLMEETRVVRLESLSAYMVRREQFDACLICDDCHSVQLTLNPDAVAQLCDHAREHGFKVDKTVIETHGRCLSCAALARRDSTAAPPLSSTA